MMEGMLYQRVTPLLKCMVLFLFIFTAKVLTSRPHESQDTRNNIQHQKPAYYVRTFTKYHHRRTIQWKNIQDPNFYWQITQDQPKNIEKRSLLESDEYTDSFQNENSINQFASESLRENFVGEILETNVKHENAVSNEVKKAPEVRAAVIITDAPSTLGPTLSCLYKLHSVSISVTPSYRDDKNAQFVVENEIIDAGTVTDTTLVNGETVQIEQCKDPKAYCYTLLHQDTDGNTTVLGQGCWRSSQVNGQNACDKCITVTAKLPGSKFCCCTESFCNGNFTSIREETVTIKAESTMESTTHTNYSNAVASAVAVVAILLMVVIFRRVYCKRAELDKDDLSDELDVEKGDIMGSGPDALATGLLCVDNLTLIEHIGEGKFGSVWRGSLGSTPVAVKLYSNPSAWHKEASIYALPHLAHPNILQYYGSDSRASLVEAGGRSQLVVLELCTESLRARLQRAPLVWLEFATLAHGTAAALAHLHSATATKPCVVHRDVTSCNVLVVNGTARLCDLGLAQPLYPRRDRAAPDRITEAGTLRYLAPEALEGALDLSGARAALCAVDVFALGLVLWEMLWRCSGAHAGGRAPPYCQPYHAAGLPPAPALAQMQNLVSRNKVRPPLPKGPVPESRALKIATDTCDECWDHDAEARLTAVCVEERMAELKMMLLVQGPVIHDNNLHPHPPADAIQPAPEIDKNSNCTTTQNSDVTTPLLYPDPHIGRNACIERNTNTNTQTHTVELIHKSLKDITTPAEPRVQNIEENCLSVARVSHNRLQMRENSDRMNEIRSYQRPLDYVQNDVSSHDVDRGPKQTNLLQEVKEKPKWGIRKFFERINRTPKETEVKLVADNSNVAQNVKTKTSLVDKPSNVPFDRPTNLVLNGDRTYNFEAPCTLSPPNKTLSPTMIMESEMNTDKVFKELPSRDDSDRNQIFSVIVPKVIPDNKTSQSSSDSKRSVRTSISSQSIKAGNSESEDSTFKKRLSCDNRIITNSNSGRSSRASINLELQYINATPVENFNVESPFDLNSDCSSSEDDNLLLLSDGGSKITMHAIPRNMDVDKKIYQNEVLKEASQAKTDFGFNKHFNKYSNFENEFSDPNDKENLVNGYSGDNPVYLAALNGEIDTNELKLTNDAEEESKSPKPTLKSLSIKRQHSLEQVNSIFSSSGDINLQNPAGRVKTPGDLPIAVRKARRDRALQKGRASECNRLSLYDDRMMFGNSL